MASPRAHVDKVIADLSGQEGPHLCALGRHVCHLPSFQTLPHSRPAWSGPSDPHSRSALSLSTQPPPQQPLRPSRDPATCSVLNQTPVPVSQLTARGHAGSKPQVPGTQHSREAAGTPTCSTQTTAPPCGQLPEAGLGPVLHTVVEKEPLTAVLEACHNFRGIGWLGRGAVPAA